MGVRLRPSIAVTPDEGAVSSMSVLIVLDRGYHGVLTLEWYRGNFCFTTCLTPSDGAGAERRCPPPHGSALKQRIPVDTTTAPAPAAWRSFRRSCHPAELTGERDRVKRR